MLKQTFLPWSDFSALLPSSGLCMLKVKIKGPRRKSLSPKISDPLKNASPHLPNKGK